MKILIAEDDPIPRRLLQASLVKGGYEVVIALDGAEAWQRLQEKDAPNLVILDWMMPGMDGVEVCRKVRERTDAPYVYILLLTSKDRKEDIIAGLNAGADDYLTKPFDPHELQVRLHAGQRILDLEAALRNSLAEIRQAQEQLALARQREGEIGARIQQTLLLGRPPGNLPGGRVAALTIPSQHIDGDFYDFYYHRAACLDVVVGDVMGKGVPAALLAAAIKSHTLRALSVLLSSVAPGQLPEPEEIVAMVHSEVTGQFIGLEFFATLCYARFDLERHRITFVDCGHTKTIHYHQRMGVCDMIEGDNMPLGCSEGEVYKQATLPFAPGDLFFFYSDGVTEAKSVAGEFFGEERLLETVRANSGLSPEELIERVREAVVAFCGADRFSDDLTCVAVKIEDRVGTEPVPSLSALAYAEWEVSSATTELARLRTLVREFCRDLPPPLDIDSLHQIQLAITEAASNVMRHAYGGRLDAQIELTAEAYADRLVFRLYHTGEAFDPQMVKMPAFDGSRQGGFGVYIIAQCMDAVSYSRDEQGRHCIELIKYRHQNRRDSEDTERG
jgi:phosphoserine phosphatase RsbU/P